MADRPKGYGMTAELQDKKNAKFDQGMAEQAAIWIEEVTDTSVSPIKSSGCEGLVDGVALCELINILQPGSVKKINKSTMAFKRMENIGNFLLSCEAYGVPKADLFQTVDLFEAQNMPQVVNGLHALGRKAGTKGFSPSIGPKEASQNKREFSEEQLQEGKKVIGLQMGSNKGASQSGSTPYGLGRQIEKTNLKN